MEKLQAAIEKARSSRRRHVEESQTVETASQARIHSTSKSFDLWQKLKPIELQDEGLVERRVVTRTAREEAAPFDILRTKALLQMRQNGWKRLAITSPMPSSGKTTLACNLALALSRQSDIRSMIFDFDLRDPSINEFFATQPPYGIGETMTGQVPFEEQALRYGENLIVSMAQQEEADPTRILLAEETVSTLASIQAEFEPDVMIFDLPSVLVNDDTRAFLKNADCALIVVRADTTQHSQFEQCKREVSEHTNLLGVVLNAYRHGKRGTQVG